MTTTTTSESSSGSTGSSSSSAGQPDGGEDGGVDAGPSEVTFSYSPAWPGVTAVSVVGGFGQTTDWKKAFLTLAGDGGVWTGTASLLPGDYLYLFQVTGDADATPMTMQRYAVDPDDSAYQVCPTGTPTVPTAASDPNPCSVLTVPQGAPAALVHVSGTATVDGGAATGWLALLERDETKSHHYFANRMDVDTTGAYDFLAAPGQYRIQLQIPTFESEPDIKRAPDALDVYRRGLSSPFGVSADTAVPGFDLAYGGYAQLQPQDGGSFPLSVTFTYGLEPGATGAYAAVYGAVTKGDAGIQNIGDPWWTGKATSGAVGTATFDGGFTTMQAQQAQVTPGELYLWGDWQTYPKSDAGISWDGESLVFPISFQ
jgi:hypothetical protein